MGVYVIIEFQKQKGVSWITSLLKAYLWAIVHPRLHDYLFEIRQTNSSREVKFDEVAGWDWKNQKTSYSDSFSIEQPRLSEDELVDDVPVRGT